MTPDPALLRTRIEEVYRQRTGASSGHGALSWFADRAGVHRETVSRWVAGEREPGGPVLALLDCLERDADD